MPDLAREVLKHFDEAVKKRNLKQAMSKGLNIEAAGHILPGSEEFQMKAWGTELTESKQTLGEVAEELTTPPPQRPYQIFVRGDKRIEICQAWTVEELHDEIARMFQIQEFQLKYEGYPIPELHDDMNVDLLYQNRGGELILQKFTVETGSTEFEEWVNLGETVGEWRKRSEAQLFENWEDEDAMSEEYRLNRETPIIGPQCRLMPMRVFLQDAELHDDYQISYWANATTTVRLQARDQPNEELKDPEIQRYVVEGDPRPRYEKLVPGETVQAWMKRVVARTGEKCGRVISGNTLLRPTDEMRWTATQLQIRKAKDPNLGWKHQQGNSTEAQLPETSETLERIIDVGQHPAHGKTARKPDPILVDDEEKLRARRIRITAALPIPLRRVPRTAATLEDGEITGCGKVRSGT
jgi:hypothetical protein